MSSEIIESVAYDNYDDIQHVNFIFSQNFISTIQCLEISLGNGYANLGNGKG
jgi:hypothetical protein